MIDLLASAYPSRCKEFRKQDESNTRAICETNSEQTIKKASKSSLDSGVCYMELRSVNLFRWLLYHQLQTVELHRYLLHILWIFRVHEDK